MVKILVLALLLLAGSVSYSTPARAAADGPKLLSGLFKKGGKKTFKKNKKHKKYYHAAANKQRKAKFNSHRSMVP